MDPQQRAARNRRKILLVAAATIPVFAFADALALGRFASEAFAVWNRRTGGKKSPRPSFRGSGALQKRSGSDLLSHAVSRGVPSALEGLTSVFGMGTGVTPPI
jgi:hypothetical protein